MDNKITIIIDIFFAIFFSFCGGMFFEDRNYPAALAEIGLVIIEIVFIIFIFYSQNLIS